MVSWKEYYVYEDLLGNYEILVDDETIELRSKEDGDLCIRFDIERFAGDYFVRVGNTLINDELNSTDTFDEVVRSCLYYFYSNY